MVSNASPQWPIVPDQIRVEVRQYVVVENTALKLLMVKPSTKYIVRIGDPITTSKSRRAQINNCRIPWR